LPEKALPATLVLLEQGRVILNDSRQFRSYW
jgi:hypothetical protein